MEDFLDEEGELKYIKLAREMNTFNRNMMHVSVKDMEKHNQFLSEKVKSDYMFVFPSLNAAFRTFMQENVEKSSGRDFYLSIA